MKLLLQTAQQNKALTRPYKGITDCFTRCIKEDGVWSLWRGNWANVLRYFPTQALNFSLKEYMHKILKLDLNRKRKLDFFIKNIISGGLAGCGTTLVVYPLDFARTRLGVDLGRNPGERQFKGTVDCLTKIYKQEGFM